MYLDLYTLNLTQGPLLSSSLHGQILISFGLRTLGRLHDVALCHTELHSKPASLKVITYQCF